MSLSHLLFCVSRYEVIASKNHAKVKLKHLGPSKIFFLFALGNCSGFHIESKFRFLSILSVEY